MRQAKSVEACALLRMSATAWGYEHESFLDIGGAPEGALPSHSVIDMPLFLAPPHPDDPAGRTLCLLYERNLCAVVLSPQEWENWKSGGDESYWLRVMDAHTPVFARGRPPECDLSMTAALRKALISTAYDGYLARAKDEPFDPCGAFAYERDGRTIPPSRPCPPSFARSVSWRLGQLIDGAKDSLRRQGKTVGRLIRVWDGELVVTMHENGDAVFRPGRFPPVVDGRPAVISMTFGYRRRDLGAIPNIHHPDFQLTFAASSECVPKELALEMLEGLESIAAALPVPQREDATWFGPAAPISAGQST
jgi:hypothetical protein